MSSDQDFAISIDNVSKTYNIYNSPRDRLLHSLGFLPGSSVKRFNALTSISFDVQKGETVGLIGKNGSGKSTLLQIVCGTLTPTSGEVTVNGRIGALLELGSGFNPEFTGIENIRINGLILGLSKKHIEEKMERIIAFADIGDFINQPVKFYSSGMVVRLAFAVQAHIDPSILVVDEALAVGDELFQKKCFARLTELKKSGTSILLVSHSCSQINQHCDRAVMLQEGHLIVEGKTSKVTNIYQMSLAGSSTNWQQEVISVNERDANDQLFSEHTVNSNASYVDYYDDSLQSLSEVVYESCGAKILDISVCDGHRRRLNVLRHGGRYVITIKYELYRDIVGLRVGCFVANKEGRKIIGVSSPKESDQWLTRTVGVHEESFEFLVNLWPGYFFIGCGISEMDSGGGYLHRVIDSYVIQIKSVASLVQVGDTCLDPLSAIKT